MTVGPVLMSENFPVHWENSTDAQLCWLRENTHFPDPIKPLDFALCVQGIEHGYNQAAHVYGIPGTTYDRLFNTYVYEAVAMPQVTSVQLALQLQQAEEHLDKIMPALLNFWQAQWLPEIKQHLADWEAYDLNSASLSALVDHLQETQQRLYRLWEIHFLLFFPMVLAISLFDELYQDLFSEANSLAFSTLLAGFPNKTIESDLALWHLSRQALVAPDVAQILTQATPQTVIGQLMKTTAGQPFLAQFNAFLQTYGRRGDRWSLLAVPWIEDPTPVIKNLQDHLRQPKRDLAAELQNVATMREQSIASAQIRLAAYPKAVRTEFAARLKVAQIGYTLKEEHGYWLDFQGIYAARQVCLACGQRLAAAGMIDHVTDVFYLTLTELTTMGTVAPPSCRDLINQRRANEMHFANVTPPSSLGAMSTEVEIDDPISRAIGKVMGSGLAVATADELHGCAGAPGIVQGVVKVLHTLEDATKLTPGDILVVSMITPAWTALFATAAAVVTDGGGVLSHGAIVAREYGIPAVVSTRLATTMLRDGQTVVVNGDKGIIRVLSL